MSTLAFSLSKKSKQGLSAMLSNRWLRFRRTRSVEQSLGAFRAFLSALFVGSGVSSICIETTSREVPF